MNGLSGKKVVLTGTRRIEEMTKLVENFGGEAVIRSLQGRDVADPEHLRLELDKLLGTPWDWLIFTTGIGVEWLHRAARTADAEEAFFAKLRTTKVAARGYKTVKYLKSLDVQPMIRDDDGTTASLIQALETHGLEGASVLLQLFGDDAPDLVAALATRAGHVETVQPYAHVPPNPTDVESLLNEIQTATVDAVAFTSAQQVTYLVEFARRVNRWDGIAQRFNLGHPIAAAVGKVTAAALIDAGVEQVVVPAPECMGALIVALTNHFEIQRK